MARLGQTRWVLKWAGLGLLLVIAATWTASLWWGLVYERWYIRPGMLRLVRFIVSDGRTSCIDMDKPDYRLFERFKRGSGSVPRWSTERHNHKPKPQWGLWIQPQWGLWIRFGTNRWLNRWISLPLWMPFVLVAIPTAILWWRDRRRIPPGHCRNCGYNLTGNVSGICPECGAEIDRSAPLG